MQCLHPGLLHGLLGLLPIPLDWSLATRVTKVYRHYEACTK